MPARKGWIERSLSAEKVGPIEKAVSSRASATSTWLGGVSGIPKAWRIIDSTTTMRTNEVMQTSRAGISAIIVRMRAMRITLAVGADWPAAAPSAAAGSGAAAAKAAAGASSSSASAPARRRRRAAAGLIAPPPPPQQQRAAERGPD